MIRPGKELILFWATTRRMFSWQAAPLFLVLLALPLAAVWVETPDRAAAWTQCLGLTLAGAILLSMNLFPQEMEDGTLETTFTLPTSRNRLVLRQLAAVWVWMLFCFACFAGLYHALADAPVAPMAASILPPALFFSAFTVWLSALVKNGPLAGLLAALVAFVHYRYLPDVGFLHLFENPFTRVVDSAGRVIDAAELASPASTKGAIFWSLVLTWLFVEFLLRRMRRSELWLK